MKLVDKLVKDRKNHPFFAYLYVVAYGTKEDQIHSLETAILKYKQPAIEAVYAHKVKNEAAFDQYQKESIGFARGVQKYVLIHTFEQMKTDL